jgi:hypothetical protein
VKIDQSSGDVIKKEGGWLLAEDLYSPSLKTPYKKGVLTDLVRKLYQPVKIFDDKSPNWPFFPQDSDKIYVYHLQPQ